MHEGVEEVMEQWSRQNRDNEVLNDTMDGEIWKTLKAADGSRFFDTGYPKQLQLGFTCFLLIGT
jgi:hypothetical protein